jgi:hypothetical protein
MGLGLDIRGIPDIDRILAILREAARGNDSVVIAARGAREYINSFSGGKQGH